MDNSYKVDVENLMESYNVIENILYALLRAKGEINDLFHIAEFMISSAHTNKSHKASGLYSIGFTKNFTSYKNASVGYERYQKLLLKILFKLVHGSDLEDNLGVIFITKDQSPDEPNQRTQETSIFASSNKTQFKGTKDIARPQLLLQATVFHC